MRLSERGPRRCFPPKRTISPRQKRLLLPFPSDRIPPGADGFCTVVPLRSTNPKPLVEHHGERLVGGVSFVHPFPDRPADDFAPVDLLHLFHALFGLSVYLHCDYADYYCDHYILSWSPI